MFDGSFHTFEMVKRPDTAVIIAVQEGKILLTHQSQPHKLNYYSLFSGRVEPGEEPVETAKRELLEEGGLVSDHWELYTESEPTSKIDWTIYTYIAQDCRKVANQTLDVGERIEVISYSFDEFVSLLLSEDFGGKELALDVARMKAKGTLDVFKKKLFP